MACQRRSVLLCVFAGCAVDADIGGEAAPGSGRGSSSGSGSGLPNALCLRLGWILDLHLRHCELVNNCLYDVAASRCAAAYAWDGGLVTCVCVGGWRGQR